MKTVFLDRDGTINVDKGYVHKVEDFVFLPGAIEGLKILSKKYRLIIVTNQSGIGRGLYTLEDMKIVNDYMLKELSKNNIAIERIYYCPHSPEENCNCRKPNIGMLNMAKDELGIKLKKSYLIGDSTSDIKAGYDAGCTTILVRTGKAGMDGRCNVNPDFIVNNLIEAAKKIIEVENES